MMGLLQRHVVGGVLRTAAVAMGVFGGILVTGNVTKDLLDYLLAGRLPWPVAVKLVGLLIPFVCTYALPVGMLLGVLLVLGRMSAQHEIVAMRAAGLGFRFLAAPILIVAAGLVGLGLGINYYYMPRARVAYHRLLADALRNDPLGAIVTETFIREFPGVVIYVSSRERDVLHDVWVWRLNEAAEVTSFLHAAEARVVAAPDANDLVLNLVQVSIETRNRRDPADFHQALESATAAIVPVTLHLGGSLDVAHTRTKLDWFTLPQLRAEKQRLEGLSATARTPADDARLLSVKTTLQSKAATAWVVFPLTLLAIPLATMVSRRETSANFAVALAVVLTYYFLTTLVGLTSNHPALHPDYLVWLPGFLLLLGGIGAVRHTQLR